MSFYAFICLLFMLASFTLFIYGFVKHQYYYVLGGVLLYFFFPVILETLLNIYAKCSFDPKQYIHTLNKKRLQLSRITQPIVYHPRYNVTAGGIEKCHPFDSQKYGKIYRFLVNKNIISADAIHTPTDPTRAMLLQVHSFLHLFKLCYSYYISRCVELPLFFLPASLLRWRLLDPMLLATQGTIDAGLLALERGWAINLSGGYHHASAQCGGGFCIYSDITLCIKHLQRFCPERVRKAMIIDLDAHQGNGYARDFMDDDSVYIVDAYNHSIYPRDNYAKRAIKCDISVYASDDDDGYLKKLRDKIIPAIQEFQPDFIMYNAGTDCLVNDPLGGLNVSAEGISRRDELIFQFAIEIAKKPIVMVLSGGYQQVNAAVISESIINLNRKFNILSERFNFL